jgi:hypothetical protein
MKTKNYLALIIAIAFLTSIFAPLTVCADTGIVLAPRLHVEQSKSTNWSGYAAVPASGEVTSVQGSWVVPAVTGAKRTTSYSSFWIGIDGYGSDTVEQIGTDSDIQNGRATYYAWFEFYPNPAYKFLRFPVQPGDVITASVTCSGDTFTLSLKDVNTKKTVTVTSTVTGASKSSAEWVAEAPSSMSGVLPLANFNTVQFSSCTASINGGAQQTIASFLPMTYDSSGNPISGYDAITMTTSAGTAKATPSPLNTAGNGFSVTWNSAGP